MPKKTPGNKTKRKPNIKTKLVRDLKKEVKELKRSLKEKERDLRSLVPRRKNNGIKKTIR